MFVKVDICLEMQLIMLNDKASYRLIGPKIKVCDLTMTENC